MFDMLIFSCSCSKDYSSCYMIKIGINLDVIASRTISLRALFVLFEHITHRALHARHVHLSSNSLQSRFFVFYYQTRHYCRRYSIKHHQVMSFIRSVRTYRSESSCAPCSTCASFIEIIQNPILHVLLSDSALLSTLQHQEPSRYDFLSYAPSLRNLNADVRCVCVPQDLIKLRTVLIVISGLSARGVFLFSVSENFFCRGLNSDSV